MALFECYTRYLALRLPNRHDLILSHTLSSPKTLIIITLTLCLASLASSITSDIINLAPWPSAQISSGADKIISDEKDESVYFTINNDIYKFNKELSQEYRGPVATSSKVTSGNETVSSSKILSIVRKNNQGLLFSCWQVPDFTLRCWLNKLNDLGAKTPLLWSSENKGFKTDTNDHLLALVNPTDSNDFLFLSSQMGHKDANSTQVSYLPAISRFQMTKSPKFLLLEQKSVLQHNSPSSDVKLINEYIHAFYHKEHTYFILNEYRESITAPKIKDARNVNVRMAKICNNDFDLTSYTEISIICNNANNMMAKTAYLNVSKEEPTLYIIFESVNEATIKKSSERSSILCSYSMQIVEDMFNKAISECNNGYEASNLLAKFSPPSPHPTLCSRNPSPANEWCTSKANPYIDGTSRRYNLREDNYITLNGISSINFLHLAEQGADKKEVLFIGSSSGYLTKMNFDEDLFYTIDLNTNRIKDYRIGEKTLFTANEDPRTVDIRSTNYVINNRNIVAITKAGRINQLDIDACHYYTTCHACLSTRDPLECAWCSGACSRRPNCESTTQSALSCPPIIKNFRPKKVPLLGTTKLTIEGENFATSKGRLVVRLGNDDCVVDRASSTFETIECILKSRNQTSTAHIGIDVTDESSYIYSNGTTESSEPLVFAKVVVFGLNPVSGPQTGGTLIDIYGENLDAGYNRSIFIGDLGCEVTSIQTDKISCLTKSWDHRNISNISTLEHKLRVVIDDFAQPVESRSYFAGHNLSTNFVFIADQPSIVPIGPMQIKPIEESLDTESFSYKFAFTIFAILVCATILIAYAFKKDKITQLRMKLSPEPPNDTKVSFRNPDSHKFLQTGESSIGGLVKLNGSMMSSDYFGRPEQFEQDQPLIGNMIDKETMSLLVQEKILIDRNRLTLGHVLGSGQFGRVYKGFFKVEETGEHMAVAVKTLHSKSSWYDSLDNRAFLEEGLMMKDFEHENVLALIGVTFDSNGLPMVITPFMLYGDLRSYISDEASSPTVKELIDFGTQVARGMAYLSRLKFVHRDLAARNCMLDENLIVKVADFGLSRDIYECDYFSDNKKTKLPVKWMAIESLEKSVYNTKTDVWSYGVLLWELMTRGVMPYPDVDNFDLFSYLKEGRRMLRPRYCPVILYKIMLSCWDEIPANRPTFDDLVQRVSDVITQLKIAKDGQQKVSRDVTYCDVLK